MNYYFLAAAKAGAEVEIASDSTLYSAVKWRSKKILKADLEPFVLQVQWGEIRVKRDILLKETDWAILPDSPITPALKDSYIAYRQALRDIPSQANPLKVTWPVKPV